MVFDNDMYEPGNFTEAPHLSGGDPGLKVIHVMTKCYQDPPGSPMRREGWRDNYYYLKNINGCWFLIKIESNGNGGCRSAACGYFYPPGTQNNTLKKTFSSIDKVGKLTVFNIGGNKYRLISAIHYNRSNLYIRGVMTHEEYNNDACKEK